MSAIHGTFVDGMIIPDAQPGWVNGTRVVMQAEEDRIGISEEEQDDDPDSIARWLAWMDSLRPFLTPEEEAEWQKARAERKAWELVHWEERARQLEKLFK